MGVFEISGPAQEGGNTQGSGPALPHKKEKERPSLWGAAGAPQLQGPLAAEEAALLDTCERFPLGTATAAVSCSVQGSTRTDSRLQEGPRRIRAAAVLGQHDIQDLAAQRRALWAGSAGRWALTGVSGPPASSLYSSIRCCDTDLEERKASIANLKMPTASGTASPPPKKASTEGEGDPSLPVSVSQLLGIH